MIGIFDSGLGGLTIMKELLATLPSYQLLYLGDTARTPYGNRSQAVIYDFTVQAVDYLFKQNCRLVIVACNTASAQALKKLQQEWLPQNYPDRTVLGVVRPLAEVAARQSKLGRVGVVGTRSTVDSNTYVRELTTQKASLKVYQQACPLLVPLIEEGWLKRPETMKILRTYLRPLKRQNIDTLILGCTHYPIIYASFVKVMGKNVSVLDSGKIVAEKLTDYLKRHPEVEANIVKGDNHRFLVTDINENFHAVAKPFLNREIKLEKVILS
ncbi:MAG: glutamate racemase [Patescibacteria group bacterium]|nr:glutamate racemase [Patescibacteria group bacterium]